jgi:hypothetical protein
MTTTGDGAPPATRPSIEGVEDALLRGDLSKLNPQQRLEYYRKVCESVGLNPMTKPFEYIRLNGQLTLYAKRDAAEQLRKVNGISITDLEETWRDDLCIFRAYAKDEDGRTDVATGAVDTSRDTGQDLANAIMKAETKAKRRVTLSLAGLGWLDETEVDDIPDQATEEVNVDYESGEIREQKSNSWYRQASDWLVGKVSDGEADAADVISNADSVPQSHPIDEWPDDKAERVIKRIKAAADSGKAQREPDAQTQNGGDTNPSQSGSHKDGGRPSGESHEDTQDPDQVSTDANGGGKSTTALPEDINGRNFLINAGIGTVEDLRRVVQSEDEDLTGYSGIGSVTAKAARQWVEDNT